MLYDEIRAIFNPQYSPGDAMVTYYTKNQSNSPNIESFTNKNVLANPYALISDRQSAILRSASMLDGVQQLGGLRPAPNVFPNAYEQLRNGVSYKRSLYGADGDDVVTNIAWTGLGHGQGGAVHNDRFGIAPHDIPQTVLGLAEIQSRFNPGFEGGIKFNGTFDRQMLQNEARIPTQAPVGPYPRIPRAADVEIEEMSLGEQDKGPKILFAAQQMGQLPPPAPQIQREPARDTDSVMSIAAENRGMR